MIQAVPDATSAWIGEAYRPSMPDGWGFETENGHTILLHGARPRWAVVNATGLAVARLCDGQHTVAQIVAAVAGRWAQPVAAVAQDVAACLAELERAGFLTSAVSPASPAGPGVEEPAAPAPVSATPFPDKRPPWNLHLYVTERCNLRCRHCGVAAAPGPATKLSAATVRELVDQAVTDGAEGMAFGGGEPLLRPDVAELLRYAASRLPTLLATNATLMDEQTAAELAGLGVTVQVSLDGADAATHDDIRGRAAFRRAWRGIRRMQDAGMADRITLSVTLMRPNVGQTGEIVELAARSGVRNVRFFPLQNVGRAGESWTDLAPSDDESQAAYKSLYEQRDVIADVVDFDPGLPGIDLEPPEDRPWCGLGRQLLVDAEGDIYPCLLLTTPEFLLGNVEGTRLGDALAAPALEELIALQARRIDEIAECRACAWRHFCQGGCPAGVWLRHGTWYATDGMCDLRRARYRKLVLSRAGGAA